MPASIEKFIREYIRQRNLLLFLRGLLTMAVVMLGWATLCCLVDRLAHLGHAARMVILGASVAWFATWSSAPAKPAAASAALPVRSPSVPRPRPSAMIPMFSTL